MSGAWLAPEPCWHLATDHSGLSIRHCFSEPIGYHPLPQQAQLPDERAFDVQRVEDASGLADATVAKAWYIAQCKPNSAEIARRNLQRQNFEVFLPLERVTRAQGNRFVNRTAPYFPGYLFVALNPASAPWRAIRSTSGIAQLVSLGGLPSTVPAELIRCLMASCDAAGVMHADPAIAPGDRVRVTNGPFASQAGQVLRAERDERIWVLLEIMGRETRVALKRTDLRLTG